MVGIHSGAEKRLPPLKLTGRFSHHIILVTISFRSFTGEKAKIPGFICPS